MSFIRREVPFVLLGALAATLAHAGPPQTFPTPEAAIEALVKAAKSGEDTEVLAVMGSDARQLVQSGDAVADRNVHQRFVTLYDEAHSLITVGEDRRVLQVGSTEWPLPIPLVKGKSGWFFDISEGKAEILARRIGQNELNAIQVCLAITDAERDYLALNPEHSAPARYASKFVSAKGKRDGLYWPTEEGEPPSPLGPSVAQATAEGYQLEQSKATPYHGYYYRILSAQGPHAEGGAVDYKLGGQLYGGFALVAYPAQYGTSGVMTFIVNHDGVVFQKDFGKDTAALAKSMKRFDPDPSWTKVIPSS